MGLTEKSALVSQLSPPLDNLLVVQLLEEYVSLERRFILRDWEPAELDGGQFCEVAARLVYSADALNVDRSRSLDECLKYVEDPDNRRTHDYPDRRSLLHIAKVLRTVYKFRSERGAVHISPSYSANHMDSRLMSECVRWVLNDFIRLFWRGSREDASRAVRELLAFDVPCIGKYES
jgi:hypothetical protein